MSTLPERLEKRCLNCDALIYGRYCQVCGQENVKHKMSFLGIIKHFVFDLLHFDGKFFNTVGKLFSKPGRVPLEYVEGKRMKYLEPFRMYLFTSTVFFILYFTFFNQQQTNIKVSYDEQTKKNSSNSVDGIKIDTFNSFAEFKAYYIKTNPKKKLNLFNELVLKKFYKYPRELRDNSRYFTSLLLNELLHKVPQIIFCILPFFVGLLKLLYHKNKNFVYSDHGIFALYMFSFAFIFIFGVMLVNLILEKSGLQNLKEVISILLFFGFNLLFFLAQKKFYQQSIAKTLLKFVLLVILNLIFAIIVFALYTFISFLLF